MVGIGWVGITLGLASVGASSQVIGRPVWWADDVRWGTGGVIAIVLTVFAISTAVVVVAFLRGPAIPQVSMVGGLLLAFSAVLDRDASPGGAVVTAALAASAVLIGIGALSDRRAVHERSAHEGSAHEGSAHEGSAHESASRSANAPTTSI